MTTNLHDIFGLPKPGFSNERGASGLRIEKVLCDNSSFRNSKDGPMQTECSATLFEFEAVKRPAVMAGFDGGDITSNAGALLLGRRIVALD